MSEYEGKTRRERDLNYMESPYREGTKLDRIFLFMRDGRWHTLTEITPEGYPPSNLGYYPHEVGANSYNRRRVASALRTIRSHPNLTVEYHCSNGYRLARINDAGYQSPRSLRSCPRSCTTGQEL